MDGRKQEMTDRVQNLTVFLKEDLREDDAEELLRAISLLKGVSHVQLGEPVDNEDFLARQRVYNDVRWALLDVLRIEGIHKKKP